MILRRPVSLMLSLAAVSATLVLAGCTTLQSIAILPAAGTTVLTGIGQTVQFTAFGQSQMGTAPVTTSNISNSVTWSTGNPSVAVINSSGLATAVGPGFTQVTAISNGIVATSDVTVTLGASGGSGTGTGNAAITSITVIPGTQSVASPGKTAQFIAVGATASGATSNLTNQVAWSSSSQQIASIGAVTGLATAVGQGSSTITALYTSTSGGVVTGTATFSVVSGTTQQYTSVTILPGSQALSAQGQTGQFIALATSGSTGLQQDVTSSSQIKWGSSIPSVATVSATGLVTGITAGNSTVSVELTNSDGSVVTGTASVAVSITSAPEPLLSLTIIPGSITVGNLQDTGQFLAIGNFSTAPYVRDLTNSPTLTWISSLPSVFPVNSNSGGNSGATAGIVTAYGAGNVVIIAEAKSTDGTIQTATANFSCPAPGSTPTPGTCYQGSQAPALLATLTIYNEGLNNSGWLITAPSATGTANVIHCGPAATTGGSVCVATYPIGTAITVTAPAEPGVNFGGWTSNCTPVLPINAPGPNSCSVVLTTDDTVGAIFN
jgi:hypothetical protein